MLCKPESLWAFPSPEKALSETKRAFSYLSPNASPEPSLRSVSSPSSERGPIRTEDKEERVNPPYEAGAACRGCSKEPTGRVPVPRVIEKLDRFFAVNDLSGAEALLDYWEAEGRALGDERGLLAILNEKAGLYRRTENAGKGLAAAREACSLVEALGIDRSFSGGTILLNAATTMKAFGEVRGALTLYERAKEIYDLSSASGRYEYAALCNNMASACEALSDYVRAEALYREAIALLEKEGRHDGEIAVSYVNLAHLCIERDPSDKEAVDRALSRAWEFLTSDRQPHDANYAFICSKCAPSYAFFGREDEANALAEVAKEIYERS